jgi:hypothetical protein
MPVERLTVCPLCNDTKLVWRGSPELGLLAQDRVPLAFDHGLELGEYPPTERLVR